MRAAVTPVAAIAVLAAIVCAARLHPVPFAWLAAAGQAVGGQPQKAPKTYGVFFPQVVVPSGTGISLVRVVVTCGQIAAVVRIPDDWYVQTLRPALQSGPAWTAVQFASSAVEFSSGHGVSRLSTLGSLDGAIGVTVDDSSCFDMTADVQDEIGSGWKTRLRRAQLRLRN